MSYESQIVDTVTAHPGSRAIQIADRIDLDLDVVEQILVRLVGAGTLTTRMADAPNDRKVTEYSVKSAGAAVPASTPAQQVASAAAAAKPATTLPPAAAASKPKRAYNRKAKPAARQAAQPAQFRCALWSDGILEIRRGADDIYLLTPDEQAAIMRALDGAPHLSTVTGG